MTDHIEGEIATPEEAAQVQRALGVLDGIADLWAANNDIEGQLRRLVPTASAEWIALLLKWTKQAFVEGAYEGRTSATDEIVALKAEIERLRATPKPLDGESSRIVELFGDRYDGPRDRLCGGQLTDLQVAHQTAMLGRNDVAFEGVLATAKDRIRWLSRQFEIVRARSTQKEATDER